MSHREEKIRWLATHEEHGLVQFRIGRIETDFGAEIIGEWNGLARLIASRTGKNARFTFEPGADERRCQKILRGSGMLLLRHLRGEIAMHAGAVSIAGRALAFLGRSGAGKSTAVAACCTYFGGALLADDALAIDRVVEHGAARYIVLPTEEDHWLIADDEKTPIHAEKIADRAVPLAAFVALEFGEGPATLTKAAPLAAIAALVPSMARFVVDEEAEQRADMDRVLALANEVPVLTLTRPRDKDALFASHRPLVEWLSRLTPLALVAFVSALLVGCNKSDLVTSVTIGDAGTLSDATIATPVIDSDAGNPGVSVADVSNVIAPARPPTSVPALAAAVIQNGVLVAQGASGIRKIGDAAVVTLNDQWQLGADVQAMTATLAALLVEDGSISWSSTLSEILPDVPMDASYMHVQLDWLLEERGGAPTMIPAAITQAMHGAGDPQSLREEAVRAIVASPTEVAAGGDFHPSDAGFLIAAMMLERASNDSWESMIAARLFAPLGMTSCAFVGPEVGSAVTVPWGHVVGRSAAIPLVAVAPGSIDEPARADGPAGAIRCSLVDWAKFCALHLHGALGEPTPILSPASFLKLQTPFDISHALGWNVVSRPWAGDELALTYETNDASFYGIVWIAPADDISIIAVTNTGDRDGNSAANDAVGRLIAAYVNGQ